MDRFRNKPTVPNGDVPAPICRMIVRSIARADVISLVFARLQRTLVMDMRPGAGDHPAIFVTQMLSTTTQELAEIERRRPGLVTINRYERATWGGSMRAFAEQGIQAAILGRMAANETQDALAVFAELQDVERTATTQVRHAKVPLVQLRAEGNS